jgi:hypothetical protein
LVWRKGAHKIWNNQKKAIFCVIKIDLKSNFKAFSAKKEQNMQKNGKIISVTLVCNSPKQGMAEPR